MAVLPTAAQPRGEPRHRRSRFIHERRLAAQMAAARPSQTVNTASAPARPNSSALWPISSSDSSVSTALMSVVEPQQPGYLAHSDAAAAPVERLPHRQTLF